MSAKILDGSQIASCIKAKLKAELEELQRNNQRIPGLAMVLVGNDPSSAIYVRNKTKACVAVGFKSVNKQLSDKVTQAELLQTIDECNADDAIDGILVQLPLPAHLDTNALVERIHPDKDVDGFHPYNLGRLALRLPRLQPATPKGVMHLLAHTGVSLRGMHATIVGASNHVGRPMGLELLLAGCTTTTIHKFTKNAKEHARQADILISAVGKPGLIQADWIKTGAIVIDVGLTRDAHGNIAGDVDFEGAKKCAGWLTPVPGGVGPMTIAALLENTMYAARHLHGL